MHGVEATFVKLSKVVGDVSYSDWWFTPGGRIRKNEALAQALQRVAREELGLAPDFCGQLLGKARLMGAWDHFYPDSAFSASVSTHYVNLPHWLPLSWAEVALLKLPMGEQHSAWQWLPLADATQSPLVHPYVRPYAAWVLCRPGAGAIAAWLAGPSLAGRNVRRRLTLAKPESGWI